MKAYKVNGNIYLLCAGMLYPVQESAKPPQGFVNYDKARTTDWYLGNKIGAFGEFIQQYYNLGLAYITPWYDNVTKRIMPPGVPVDPTLGEEFAIEMAEVKMKNWRGQTFVRLMPKEPIGPREYFTRVA